MCILSSQAPFGTERCCCSVCSRFPACSDKCSPEIKLAGQCVLFCSLKEGWVLPFTEYFNISTSECSSTTKIICLLEEKRSIDFCEHYEITADILRWQQTCKSTFGVHTAPVSAKKCSVCHRNVCPVSSLSALIDVSHFQSLCCLFPEHFPTSCPKPLFPRRNLLLSRSLML